MCPISDILVVLVFNNCISNIFFCFPEYHYEVKQLYQKKCSLRQHLLNLQLEKEKVKYLDGGSRGKPRNQWDTSVDDVILRHARATQQFPTRVSKFNDNTKHEKQSQDVLPEPTKSRLVPCGFLTVASEEEIPPKISRKPLTLKISNKTRFPNINDNQRVTSSHSDFTPRMRHPGLPHNHTTLETVPSFVLTRRRLSRSLTDLRDLRQRSNTLQSTV